MTERERFERWAVSRFGTIHRTVTGTYGGKDDPVQAAYEAWQARAEIAQEREKMLLDALQLAVAALSGANVDMKALERKIKQALDQWGNHND